MEVPARGGVQGVGRERSKALDDFELFSQFQITSDQHRVTVLPSAALTFGREAVDRERYSYKRIALPQQRYW